MNRPALPSGTVAFFFSDIEGSTRRWDRGRDAMQHAVRRHDALVRAQIQAHGGHVFKTLGDAFCAAFHTVPSAIAAAVGAQRAISAEDWSAVGGLRVRIAIHSGDADERDGDYFGPTLNRTARLLAIGHGGQTLISRTAAELAHEGLAAGTSLRDLGEHHLKDLERDEAVYQVCAAGLVTEFPALNAVNALPSNLPPQPTAFIGRANEIAEVSELLRSARLVTILGTGGMGKTRLSLEAGTVALTAWADGACFVELAPVADPALVPDTILAALGLQMVPGFAPIEVVTKSLRGKRMLLILDNCEHVVAAAAEACARVLRDAPSAIVLATSRIALGIAGEHVYRMPAMSDTDALTLFETRARARDARFGLSGDTEPAVRQVCRRLDGLPLAIEMAAARTKMLTPRQLLEKLDERFRVLTGGDRTALPRQQTMRALIDWSYDLLDARERALLRRLGVFSGGFTLEAAADVCSGGDVVEDDVFDLVATLVDNSLVDTELHGDAIRYRLLETTRAYALDKVREHDELRSYADRHADAMLRFAQAADAAWPTSPDLPWIERFSSELDNLRAALAWTFGDGNDPQRGLELLAAFVQAAQFEPGEALRWLPYGEHALDERTPVTIRARLALMSASAHRTLHVLPVAQQAAQLARSVLAGSGNDALTAVATLIESSCDWAIFSDDELATQWIARLLDAARVLRAAGQLKHVGLAHQWIANVALGRGNEEMFAAHAAEARRIYRSLGADYLLIRGTINIAEGHALRGEFAEARRMSEVILPATEQFPHARTMVVGNLARYALGQADFETALDLSQKAFELARRSGGFVNVLFELESMTAAVLCNPRAKGYDVTDAARMVGFVDAALAAYHTDRQTNEARIHEQLVAVISSRLAPDAAEAAMREGSRLTEDEAFALAASLSETQAPSPVR